jgi:hypothetical protein
MAQDPTGALEGQIAGPDGQPVSGAALSARQSETGLVRETNSNSAGYFRLTGLPAGTYELTTTAARFTRYIQQGVPVDVGHTVRLDIALQLASVKQEVTVVNKAALVDTASNVLGKTITGREILDLPLNGRNFTQLGLLQPGMAPLTQGVATAGGSLRQGQSYAVNECGRNQTSICWTARRTSTAWTVAMR